MAMVQGRLPLLEKAVATALGSPRQVVLEAGHGGSGVGAQTGIGMPATAPAAAGAPVTAAPGPQATTPAPTAAATTSAPTGPRTPDPEQTTARPAAGAATSTASAEPVLITERGTAPSHDPTASSGPASDTPASAPAAAAPMTAGVIDERARRLADFFNGEVVQLEEPLPGLGGGGEAAA